VLTARGLRRTVVGACLLLALAACKHNEGDSVVVTGDGTRLSSEVIDRDAFALLPAEPIALGWLDARAFLASPLGAEANRLFSRYVPLGQDTGFVLQRDLRVVVGGLYSFSGVDMVMVAQGDFHPELIKAAAGHPGASGAVVLVHSTYAGNDVYTWADWGLTPVTAHTLLLGSQTAMRRALDKIRDNRLQRDAPAWMLQLVTNPQAALVVAGDTAARPEVAALSKTAPFLMGLSTFRVLGNFLAPGLNLAGTFSYADAASAHSAAETLRNTGQLAGALNLLAVFGVASPVRKLDVTEQGSDTMFVSALDADAVAKLLPRGM
jgi:hypothetical protein